MRVAQGMNEAGDSGMRMRSRSFGAVRDNERQVCNPKEEKEEEEEEEEEEERDQEEKGKEKMKKKSNAGE